MSMVSRIPHFLTLALLVGYPLGVRGDQAPVADAIVLATEGEVRLDRAGEDRRQVTVGALLRSGDRIVPEGDSGVHIYYPDGSWERIDYPFEIVGGSEPTEPLFVRIRDLLLRFTARDPVTAPTSSETFPMPLRPANDIPVRVLTPTLVWRSAPEVEQYRVYLWDASGELRTLEATGPSAVLPSDWALSPGEEYTWAVSALPVGEPGIRVRFRVLGREGMDRVAAEMLGLREMGLDPEAHGALLALAVFQELNLIYDALGLLDGVLVREGGEVTPALLALQAHLARTVDPVPLPTTRLVPPTDSTQPDAR